MKQECSIVQDLLPLYVEDMVSPETAEFVGEHLKSCETCQAEVQSLRQPPDVTPPPRKSALRPRCDDSRRNYCSSEYRPPCWPEHLCW